MSQRMRAIAIFTLISFCWTILLPGLLPAQATANLDEARRLYKEGRLEKARIALDQLIGECTGKTDMKQSLADAYFLRAKIFLDVLENLKSEADLRQLFMLLPNYYFPGDDPEFKTTAERIRIEVKRELETKEQEAIEILRQKKEREQNEAEIKRKTEELQRQEAEKKAEELRRADAQRKKDAEQITATVKQQEQERLRLEATQKAEDARKAAAQKKLAEDQKLAEAKRLEQERLRVEAEQKAEAKRKLDEIKKAEALKKASENQTAKLVEKEGQPGLKNKKGFPWLLVIGGVAVVGVLVYFLLIKKTEYTLTVTVGAGASGSPSAGQTTYTKGNTVAYIYTMQSGYKNLVVTLDGAAVAASGTITMNGNHTLAVSATPLSSFTLTVTKGAGVNGTPEAGSVAYIEGATVTWNYTLQSSYQNLVVTLDNTATTASGSVVMNGNHALVVSATHVSSYTLTVTKGAGVNGTPEAGSVSYTAGATVTWSYTLQSSYQNLVVTLDGAATTASGSVVMNGDHSLNASATIKEATYIAGVLTVKGVIYNMQAIPGGSFQMGSVSAESSSNEQPVHTVTISAFYMGKTEVTQGLWKVVMGTNPSVSRIGDTYPVDTVSWTDCQAFVSKLNLMVGGSFFRMPTEAQWEYACRAGTTGDRYGNIDAIAWYSSNSGSATHPVGQKQPNAWGLYDMLGNVWEKCSDYYDAEYYHVSPTNNPTGPAWTSLRAFRGGGWGNGPDFTRSPGRTGYDAGLRDFHHGLRLAAVSAGN